MTVIDAGRAYSTHEAARMAGVTYRQASHWCAGGVLGARLRGLGSGSHRRWASADVLALCSVAAYARVVHGWNDEPRGSAGVHTIGPAIAEAVRACPSADWLTVTPDRKVGAHRDIADAIRAISLRGGLLVDLGTPA